MTDSVVILGLKTRRASIAADIDELDKQRRQLLISLRHVDATLKLMGFHGNPEAIKSKRKRRSMFRRGELRRLVFSAQRVHGEDASNKEIAAYILKQMDWTDDGQLLEAIIVKVRNARKDVRRTLMRQRRKPRAANTLSTGD